MKAKIEKMQSFKPEELSFGGKTPTSGDLALRIALSLLGMAERVAELPLNMGEIPRDYESEDGGSVDDKTGWDRARASISPTLKGRPSSLQRDTASTRYSARTSMASWP